MAFRRRRKPRVVWLPPAADNRIDPTNPSISPLASGSGQLILDGTMSYGQTTTGFSPLVSDSSAAAFQQGGLPVETLADIYSSGYRLRRIVGKIFCELAQPGVAVGDLPTVLITAGIIVLRVDPGGQPLQAATPQAYDPQAINQWADPYVWRRTWKLGVFSEEIALGNATWPENNYQCGSVMDGPHVDAKTARVLGREERLFLVVSALCTASPSGGGAGHFQAVITWDLRFVGSMRTQQGNRRNASR